MTEVRIYFEGDASLRPGFRELFKGLGGAKLRLNLIACGADFVADFVSGVKRNPNALNILLQDAEGPYSPAVAQETRRRINRYDSGQRIADDQLHFMVPLMESWFLADRATLRNYYGPGFAENRLPANRQVEEILKEDVINDLANATRDTAKGRYHKTRHAPELLARIDAARVRAAAPIGARLFRLLEQLNGTAPPG